MLDIAASFFLVACIVAPFALARLCERLMPTDANRPIGRSEQS
ncbi:MAG: hypothetical protein U0572_17655 [Phycisphaerales bacterium]